MPLGEMKMFEIGDTFRIKIDPVECCAMYGDLPKVFSIDRVYNSSEKDFSFIVKCIDGPEVSYPVYNSDLKNRKYFKKLSKKEVDCLKLGHASLKEIPDLDVIL